jgi:hypothetical protein
MGFLSGLVSLISQNDVFSTRHATGALWNLVVENNGAKMSLVSDESFCKKLVELFSHSDAQVLHCTSSRLLTNALNSTHHRSQHTFAQSSFALNRRRCANTRSASQAKCVAKTFK